MLLFEIIWHEFMEIGRIKFHPYVIERRIL